MYKSSFGKITSAVLGDRRDRLRRARQKCAVQVYVFLCMYVYVCAHACMVCDFGEE